MKNKPTFLHQNKPLNTCMIQVGNKDDAYNHIRNAAYEGCDAYGFQMECYSREQRDPETIRTIFNMMDGKPIYVTNYRDYLNEGDSDESLIKGLFMMQDCGATMLDIMGDLFDPSPLQLTTNPTAIEKQKSLIAEIHERGGEVLMSSHTFQYISSEEVLRIAKAHEERGADIAKIVTAANSEEEEWESFRMTTLLKKELNIPFLFLCIGTHNRLHRTLSPLFGNTMWLSVYEHHNLSTKSQPVCHAINSLRGCF